MSPENPRARLAREAIRLHQRYQRELIERFSICPWANPARVAGRIRTHVIIDLTLDPEEVRPVVEDWARDAEVEVAFLIAPRFELGVTEFFRWAETVGALESGAFLAAPFHPDVSDSAGAVRFLRQTPDPTVQLVRRATLDAIRSKDPPHYKDIFELDLRDLDRQEAPRSIAASLLSNNLGLIEREGKAALQSIIEDIRDDRERTYAPILSVL